MKTWEWMNETAKEPQSFEEILVGTYAAQLIDMVDHYADPGDLQSALEHFDPYALFKGIRDWLNSEHK